MHKCLLLRALFAALLLLPLLPACSSSGVKGEAPFVQVLAWQLQGDKLQVSLRLRNVNDEKLTVKGLTFTVLLEETLLARYQASQDMVVPATGAETLELSLAPTADGLALLNSLQSGQQSSLPYNLEGTISAAGLGELRFNRAGRIFPVPGRPGQFR